MYIEVQSYAIKQKGFKAAYIKDCGCANEYQFLNSGNCCLQPSHNKNMILQPENYEYKLRNQNNGIQSQR